MNKPWMADLLWLAHRQKTLEDATIEWAEQVGETIEFIITEVLKTEMKSRKDYKKLFNDIKYKTKALKEELGGLSESHQGFIQFYLAEQQHDKPQDFTYK